VGLSDAALVVGAVVEMVVGLSVASPIVGLIVGLSVGLAGVGMVVGMSVALPIVGLVVGLGADVSTHISAAVSHWQLSTFLHRFLFDCSAH